MPNVLPFKVRARVVRSLVEGNSIRSAARLTKTDKDAVMNLGATVGEGCKRLHDKLVQHVPARNLEIDETWSFVGRHERRKTKADPASFGDQYTMFAMDPDTKFVPSYETGKRTLPTATAFMADLRARVDGKPQITFDGWPHWIEATRRTFGHRGAHVATTVKEYQKGCRPDDTARGCGRVKSQTKTVIYGRPNQKRISTSKAERFNLTSRMVDRRLTRLTNAYSKKLENHEASAGLHYFWYNFVRVHESLGTTPAVKAGLADYPWTIEEMTKVALAEVGAEAPEAKGRRRNLYQRKSHTLDADKPPPVRQRPRARGGATREVTGAAGVDDASEGVSVASAAIERRKREKERGFVRAEILPPVALFTTGVAVGITADGWTDARPLGPSVSPSRTALAASLAGGLLAHGLGRRAVARGAVALALGVGTGMLARGAAGRALMREAKRDAPAPALTDNAARVSWWRRALRWLFG